MSALTNRDSEPLRFITCGNVDDGKSTLIGRLLWDTQSVKSDHAEGIAATPIKLPNGETHPDFANLLDGLQAEREQGITIDVAYRYFSSAKRSFIVADTPGHEQYTRNMVTGASNADLAILLIDAQTGVTEQTRRHAFIAYNMGISQVVFAINKMDLLNYREQRYDFISQQIADMTEWMQFETTSIIPVAAVHGYNVVSGGGDDMAWYKGPTILEVLETAKSGAAASNGFRMCVQRISRPDESFRGYQGTVHGGELKVGQAVVVQPSNQKANIKSIVTFDGEIESASAGDAVTIELDRKIDIARGDFICDAFRPLETSSVINSRLVILDDRGLDINKRYWLKTQSYKTRVTVTPFRKIALQTGDWIDVAETEVNNILEAEVRFGEAFAFDRYAENRHTGSFILIDPDDYSTVAGGTILNEFSAARGSQAQSDFVRLTMPADLVEILLQSNDARDRFREINFESGTEKYLDAELLQELKAASEKPLTIEGAA